MAHSSMNPEISWQMNAWMLHVYNAHQNITMRELDNLVQRGVIKPLGDVKKTVHLINKHYCPSLELQRELDAYMASDAS